MVQPQAGLVDHRLGLRRSLEELLHAPLDVRPQVHGAPHVLAVRGRVVGQGGEARASSLRVVVGVHDPANAAGAVDGALGHHRDPPASDVAVVHRKLRPLLADPCRGPPFHLDGGRRRHVRLREPTDIHRNGSEAREAKDAEREPSPTFWLLTGAGRRGRMLPDAGNCDTQTHRPVRARARGTGAWRRHGNRGWAVATRGNAG
jgi:hypothetical protein